MNVHPDDISERYVQVDGGSGKACPRTCAAKSGWHRFGRTDQVVLSSGRRSGGTRRSASQDNNHRFQSAGSGGYRPRKERWKITPRHFLLSVPYRPNIKIGFPVTSPELFPLISMTSSEE